MIDSLFPKDADRHSGPPGTFTVSSALPGRAGEPKENRAPVELCQTLLLCCWPCQEAAKVLGLPSGLPTCWRTSRSRRWTEHTLARQRTESGNGTEASTGSLVRRRVQSDLAIAFIDALDADACLRLAERLRPHLRSVVHPSDEWLDSEATAEYLSLPRSTLHKLTAERAIPFEQDGRGCKLYFKRSALDAWRES